MLTFQHFDDECTLLRLRHKSEQCHHLHTWSNQTITQSSKFYTSWTIQHYLLTIFTTKTYPSIKISIRSKLSSKYEQAINFDSTLCLCKFAMTWVASRRGCNKKCSESRHQTTRKPHNTEKITSYTNWQNVYINPSQQKSPGERM